MKIDYLHKENNNRLILIFTGWSCGPEIHSGLEMPGWDVAVVYDYLNPEFDMAFFERYCTVYLFAWSIGVAEADRILPADRITAAFAINGTVTPRSDSYGIPVEIYDGTVRNLSSRNLHKFHRRMMPDAESFRRCFPQPEDESRCSALALELEEIAARYSDRGLPRLKWTRAYIGEEDHIFPPGNMFAAWNQDPEVRIIKTQDTHYVDVESIINGVIPDTMKVSRRFQGALSTYNSSAVPQQMIALHLASLLKKHVESEISDILEIGPGTGFLTDSYSEYLAPKYTDLVDIVAIEPLVRTGETHCYVDDAEAWIRTSSSEYDLVASSSVIQWFADIPAFFRQCARILRPGGLLAIATFLPGNLEELDSLRPSPLLYLTPEELRNALGNDFEILEFEANTIRMVFPSRRHLFMHLKHTGVGGNGNGTGSMSGLSNMRELTYRPVYIVAVRK